MPEIMMALGDFRFSVDTAAYTARDENTPYRWAVQERLGREPSAQWIGPGAKTATFDGTIYPHFKGGLGQIDAMRDMAGQGQPLIWTEATGKIKGKWCITHIDEHQDTFMERGIARRIDFTIGLVKYGED